MTSIKKETLVYFLGTVFLAILNFAISILYGDMFLPNDYGNYSLVFATYSLLSQVAVGWVSSSLIRYYEVHKNKQKEDRLIGSVFIQHVIFSAVEIFLVVMLVQFLQIPAETKNLLVLFSIFFFFESYMLFINTIMRVTGGSKQYSLNVNVNSIIRICVLLGLYYVVGIKSTLAIAISLLTAEIIQSAYLTIKFGFWKYFLPKNYDGEIIKQLFRYGLPLIGVSVTSWILNVSDRYIIEYFYSSYEVGLYSYSYNIANSVVTLLAQFIMLGAYPNIVAAWENSGMSDAVEIIKRYLTLYVLIVLPVCFGFLFMGRQFFEVFTNELYWGGYINFIFTGFGAAVLGLSAYTNKVWELNKKTTVTLILSAVAAVVNVALNFWLIPQYGYTAGSVTTLIAYVVYILLSVLWGRKSMKLHVDWAKILKILVAVGAMSIVIMPLNLAPVLDGVGGFVLKMVIGVVVYLMINIMTGALNFSDFREMLKRKR